MTGFWSKFLKKISFFYKNWIAQYGMMTEARGLRTEVGHRRSEPEAGSQRTEV